jgi:hypothetical protein
MLFQTEHRVFAVGRVVGTSGRCTRFVPGLLGLISIGLAVAKIGPSSTLIGQIGLVQGFIQKWAIWGQRIER